MLALVYIFLSVSIGYICLKVFIPEVFSISDRTSFFGKPIVLKKWMVVFPSSYLIGTLLVTWLAYMSCFLFRASENPMLLANIAVFLVASICFFVFFARKNHRLDLRKNIKRKNFKVNFLRFIANDSIEIIFVLAWIIVWAFYMFRSFYIKDNVMFVGYSVFSDFSPHLAVIRSFSMGANFPTQYPHFPDGTIRYHFLFMFLAGNLEFLGLRLDYAFNLPSILSIISFIMLFYSFAVLVFGSRLIGILSSVFFFFRSSFAAPVYLYKMKSLSHAINKISTNTEHIGNTDKEVWGLWAQKVYVNQRHLAFAFGILMLIMIILLPLTKKMIARLISIKRSVLQKGGSKFKAVLGLLREFIISIDSWLPKKVRRAVVVGVLLGLTAFFNGAVVIAGLSILCILAIFSKHRLEYLTVAIIAVLLSFIQTRFFIGSGSSVVSPHINIGFLARDKSISGILKYYIELLGLLPFLTVSLLFSIKNKSFKVYGFLMTVILNAAGIYFFTPYFSTGMKIFFFVLLSLANIFYCFYEKNNFPKGGRWLIIAFIAPIVLATTLQLTPDVTVNHKYVIIGFVLLSIMVASYIVKLLSASNMLSVIIGCLLAINLISTGLIDAITLYNLDKHALQYKTDDPILVWVSKHTKPNEIFLTPPYSQHPILLAGRKIFTGWPYFAWSAGYNTARRQAIVRRIYGARDINTVKRLLKDNNISYVVIEDENRRAKNYRLNENIFKNNFEAVYKKGSFIIYKVN